MELCSIQDAFPDIQKDKKSNSMPKPGCSDSKPSKEERRAARKLAKKCKESPAEKYYEMMDDKLPPVDPDRPAIKRMGEIPAFVAYEEAFNDLSGGKFESFKMPVLPSSNCLISDPGYPKYFGKGLEDADEGFTNMFNDSAASAQTAPETFEYEFGGQGADKAGAVKALPAPPTSNTWKPLTPAKAKTAFTDKNVEASKDEDLSKKPAIVAKESARPDFTTKNVPSDGNPNSMSTLMANQINDLTRRFDDLEAKRDRDSKNEILLFVGTGAFILVCMEIVMRISRR